MPHLITINPLTLTIPTLPAPKHAQSSKLSVVYTNSDRLNIFPTSSLGQVGRADSHPLNAHEHPNVLPFVAPTSNVRFFQLFDLETCLAVCMPTCWAQLIVLYCIGLHWTALYSTMHTIYNGGCAGLWTPSSSNSVSLSGKRPRTLDASLLFAAA